MPARLPKVIAWACLAALCAGCEGPQPEEADRGSGTSLQGVVPLSPETQRRAGIVVEAASKVREPSSLAAIGWLVARPGTEVAVKAPATGFVGLTPNKERLEPGLVISRPGEPLGEIQVVLSTQDQAALVAAKEETDVVVRQALTTLQFAQAQLQRLQQSKEAVAGTRLAELREKVEQARAAYEEAQEKLPFLPKEPYQGSLRMKPVPIEAPLAGRVVSVQVRPGQFVVQGDGLWTIADWSVLWVRVPVFELDLPRVLRQEPAQIEVPGAGARLTGKPIDAPQPTSYGQRSVDLYYQIPNASWSLRVGQAVSLLLPTGRPADRIVVPRSAVLWDGMGATWVYVPVGSGAFRRQRVELGTVFNDRVEITRGLDEGASVVTTGAEALYGQEFQGQTAVEDND